MALAGHVAADRDEHRRPEGELLGAEERGDQEVPPGPQAAVGPEGDAIAEAGPEERLVDVGQAELPRRADVLDRAQGRRPGPAAVPRQVDVRRAGLGDAGRDRPDAARGDELHPDPGGRVDRPEVGDQLGEVLDRVDVVVRRRADVAHRRLAAAEGGDPRRRLLRRQLAALAGLRALGDLDLELLAAGEVGRGHPEAGRGDLLDPGVVAGAVGAGDVPAGILAALAGVGGAAGPLDADREGLVGLRREGSHRHRADDEATDDRAGGLDLVDRDRPAAARPADPEGVADDGRPAEGRGADARFGRSRTPIRPGPRRRSAARSDGARRPPGSGRSPGPGACSTRSRRRRIGLPRGGAAAAPRAPRTRPVRATPAPPGSSASEPRRRARSSRTACRRCTTTRC